MKTKLSSLAIALAVMVGIPAAWGAGSIVNLGLAGTPNLDANIGNNMATYLVDVSADGTLVSGTSSGGNGWIWTPGNGQVTIGTGYRLVGVDWYNGNVLAVANNGNIPSYWSGNASGSGSWTALPSANGSAGSAGYWGATGLGVAADASDWWVSGYTSTTSSPYQNMLRYQNSTASATSLPAASGGHNRSFLYAASNQGTFVGTSQFGGSAPSGGSRNGVYWNSGLSAPNFLYPTAGLTTSFAAQAESISGDGTVAGGVDKSNGTYWYATGWLTTSSGRKNPFELPELGTSDWMEMHSINKNATVVAGVYYTDSPSDSTYQAFIAQLTWDTSVNQYGPTGVTEEKLSDYLASNGIDTTGWTFKDVTSISDDGNTLAGWGIYNGQTVDWVVMIPEPGTPALVAVGGLLLLALRRFRAQRANA